MNYWLVKQEPEDYAFAQLVKDKHTDWTGVRSFQARNHLRAMKAGDHVLYYHSGKEKAVVGTAHVTRPAFPDPTIDADDRAGDWVAVELAADKALPRAVTLKEIKADAALRDLLLVRVSRLSVMPVGKTEYEHILALARG
jgi:predicted RNA-binding protein with PUA-like domain